jgi:sucrose phosphorylase
MPMSSLPNQIKKRLDFIYKGDYSSDVIDRIVKEVELTKDAIHRTDEKWTERDSVLITYGDSIKDGKRNPLKVLNEFLDNYLGKSISYVHILPFFPYSSDDGFSVIDYNQVNPELGDWSDIKDLTANYKLMFDLVINHISQESEWFRNYLNGIEPGKSYFIEADPNSDLSKVVRPRSLPLLTQVETTEGLKHVWTTFSADQIDLNFKNPLLLEEMIKIFLLYLRKGANMIRLDAIAFLWKEIGTSCLHLPETHEFVKLLRDIVDVINPSLILLTETNVPNKENLSYFGNNDEAHMVYQFSLPPLLINTLYTEKSDYLTKWAMTIPELPSENTFFNFTASHDGIGVRPLEGLVPPEEIGFLIDGLKEAGALVSTKRNSDGTDSPYEINVTYFDALKAIHNGMDNLQNERFICSQTIMMTMKGVPAFYIHSLLGTHNDFDGVKQTGMNRSINRKKWLRDELFGLLDSDTGHRFIFQRLSKLINTRKAQGSFHPNCNQKVINLGSSFFCITRNNNELISISNITASEKFVNHSEIPFEHKFYKDIIGSVDVNVSQPIPLVPYQTIWLIP